MPVRIYDISKKLGLENKEVLAKAKELGIAAARVASSSLDKITAEYLEQQLIVAHPEIAAQQAASAAAPPAAEAPAPSQDTITIVRAPEPPPEAVPVPVEESATVPASAVSGAEAAPETADGAVEGRGADLAPPPAEAPAAVCASRLARPP